MITTHILDTSLGKPAEGVSVNLEKASDDKRQWTGLANSKTDSNGRLANFGMDQASFKAGQYRLVFASQEYFEKSNRQSFFPRVIIEFSVVDPLEHFHVPLLISPFGYSTYRGS